MSFQDLDEFFDSSLKLPIRGKTYIITSPDAETGLWCQRILETAVKAKKTGEIAEEDAAKLVLSDDEEQGLFERLMGPVFDEMIADKVPWEYLKHAGVTTLMWAAGSIEAAEKYWASGGQPENPTRPAPQDRKPKKTTSARPASRGGSTRQQVVKGEVVSPGASS